MGKYLGIDYGIKRIGLAVADDDARIAQPLGTVTSSQLAETITREGPFVAVVIGLPRSLDGAETAQTLAVRRFTDDMLGRLGLDPVFQDEAATSQLAEARLKEAGKPYGKADIDAEAAAIILQDYLDTL